MKKNLFATFSAALFMISIASCNNQNTTDASTAISNETSVADSQRVSTNTAQVALESNTESITASIPTFSNEDVNKGLAEYKTMLNRYMDAVKNNDQKAIAGLQEQYSVLAQQSSTWVSKLKPDEQEQYKAYFQQITAEWLTAVQNVAKP
jgi:hypothetical protein